jgi:hypothetical protein
MPHSSDDPPSAPAASVESETPGATVADAPDAANSDGANSDGANSDGANSDGANPAGPSLPDGETQQPRRRRRRRRRRPPPAAASPEAAVGDQATPEGTPLAGDTVQDTQGEAQGEVRTDAQELRPPRHRRRRRRGPPRDPSQQSPVIGKVGIDGSSPLDPTTVTPGEVSTPAQPAPGMASELPRRRGRRPPRRPGLMDPAASAGQGPSGSEAITEGTSQPAPGTVQRPWPGRPRNRRPPDRAAPDGEPRRPGPRQPRERAAGPRDAGARGPNRRDQGSDTQGRRDKRPSGRPPGRGREAPLRKPEQKLYALESVVDRGFEDVTEDSSESGTRRVHWTIINRTVADQKSGKAMSASYVLRREGGEAEFPNLGAARAAVNKTIVHPEKLTLSKAEHVAAKGSR